MSSEICIFSIKADVKEAEGLKYGEKSSKADKTTDVKSRAVKKQSFRQITSDAGSQFRRVRVGRGIQPPASPKLRPKPLTTHYHTPIYSMTTDL